MSRKSDQTSDSKTDGHHQIDTHGTTIVIIKTEELIIVGSDSRSTHNRSSRIVDDQSNKVENLISNLYTTRAGGKTLATNLFEDMKMQYNSGAQQTPKQLAEYGLKYLQKLNQKTKSQYTIIGVENRKPQAYMFSDSEKCKNVSILKDWFAHGSGTKHAKPLLAKLEGKLNMMSRDEAVDAIKIILLQIVLEDPTSGGLLHVHVFGSTGLLRHYRMSTLHLYLKWYNDNSFAQEHARTIYMFSRGQIGNDLVTQWFSSGCLIKSVNVEVAHQIGHIDDYAVRRVVLTDTEPSTVLEEVTQKCRRFRCREINGPDNICRFPCLQVVNKRFHFAILEENDLRTLVDGATTLV